MSNATLEQALNAILETVAEEESSDGLIVATGKCLSDAIEEGDWDHVKENLEFIQRVTVTAAAFMSIVDDLPDALVERAYKVLKAGDFVMRMKPIKSPSKELH